MGRGRVDHLHQVAVAIAQDRVLVARGAAARPNKLAVALLAVDVVRLEATGIENSDDT